MNHPRYHGVGLVVPANRQQIRRFLFLAPLSALVYLSVIAHTAPPGGPTEEMRKMALTLLAAAALLVPPQAVPAAATTSAQTAAVEDTDPWGYRVEHRGSADVSARVAGEKICLYLYSSIYAGFQVRAMSSSSQQGLGTTEWVDKLREAFLAYERVWCFLETLYYRQAMALPR